MLVWIIFYPINMKVSPSAQGVKPLVVVIKLNAQWAQVPPVSPDHPHGWYLIILNQQQPSESPITMPNHREKLSPNMLTKRHVSQIQLINNTTKLWASAPHMTSGLRAQNKSKKGRAPQRQITYNKGIPRVNNHEVLEIITKRDISPTLTIAYNISEGDKKFSFGRVRHPDTRNKLTTNQTHGTKETYAEVLFDYDQLINTRQTPKSYSQQLQDFTTLKNIRIKLFIWAYLGKRGRHNTNREVNNSHNITDTARAGIQLKDNITKLWASAPQMSLGLRAQNKSNKGHAPQRQNIYNKGISRVHNHEVFKIKTKGELPPLTVAYNISEGNNKLFDPDRHSDTRKKLTTNQTYGTNETYAEAFI
jgi:hypothetical protein